MRQWVRISVQVYVKISALFRVAPDASPFSSLSDRLKDRHWDVGL